MKKKLSAAVLESLVHCAKTQCWAPGRFERPSPRYFTGKRARYLARLGLVEYAEHVDQTNARGQLRMVRSFAPTVVGIEVLRKHGIEIPGLDELEGYVEERKRA